jgi:uncharacterized HhH-GPD family protein
VTGDLYITGDAEKDGLLNRDGTALLIGMQLDQQVPMEWAFMGPNTLKQRLGHLDASRIAAMDEDQFVAVCCDKPAIHRFPAVMGRRIHAMCVVLADRYGGQPERLWETAKSGTDCYARLRELPGYGEEKAQIFVALLAKRFGVRPKGWKSAAGLFADQQPRTIADCHDEASLARVREWKRIQREAKKDKQGRDLTQRAG